MNSFWTDVFYYGANALAAFIATVVGLMNDNITLMDRRGYKISITKGHLVWGLLGCIVISFLLSFRRDSFSDQKLEQKEAQHRKDDSLRDERKYRQIADLEAQHAREISDAIFKTKESNRQDLKDNTDNILASVEKQSSENKKEHKITQEKVAGSKLKPAYIELLPNPPYVFIVSRIKDSLKSEAYLYNSGQNVAYSVFFNCFFIADVTGGKRYIYNIFSPKFAEDHSSNKNFGVIVWTDKFPKYDSITNLYMAVFGKYYLDDKLKEEKYFEYGVRLKKGDKIPVYYDGNQPLKEFVNSSLPYKHMEIIRR